MPSSPHSTTSGTSERCTLLDVIEHLTQPHELLAALSAWSLKHGEAPLVVSVPNVAHFDLGLRLLCGKWILSDTGLLDSTHLRFFTERSLQRMLERCGWRVVARDNFISLRTDQYDDELNDGLPVEMVGALRALSQSYNPQATVQQFVWTLAPFPVSSPPTSYLEAMAEPEGASETDEAPNDNLAVRSYLASVGLLSSETNRRAAKHLRSGVMWRGRRVVIKKVNQSPRLSAYSKKLRGWLR